MGTRNHTVAARPDAAGGLSGEYGRTAEFESNQAKPEPTRSERRARVRARGGAALRSALAVVLAVGLLPVTGAAVASAGEHAEGGAFGIVSDVLLSQGGAAMRSAEGDAQAASDDASTSDSTASSAASQGDAADAQAPETAPDSGANASAPNASAGASADSQAAPDADGQASPDADEQPAPDGGADNQATPGGGALPPTVEGDEPLADGSGDGAASDGEGDPESDRAGPEEGTDGVADATDSVASEEGDDASSDEQADDSAIAPVAVMPTTCVAHGADLLNVTWDEFKMHWAAGCYGDGTPGTFTEKVNVSDAHSLDLKGELGLSGEFFGPDGANVDWDYQGKCLPMLDLGVDSYMNVLPENTEIGAMASNLPNVYDKFTNFKAENRFTSSSMVFVRDGQEQRVHILEDVKHGTGALIDPMANSIQDASKGAKLESVYQLANGASAGWTLVLNSGSDSSIACPRVDFGWAWQPRGVRQELGDWIATGDPKGISYDYRVPATYLSTVKQEATAVFLGGFTFQKTSVVTPDLPLAGAQYELSVKGGEKVWAVKGSTEPLIDVQGNLVSDASNFPVEVVDGANGTKTFNDAAELADACEPLVLTTDDNGEIAVTGLPTGTYSLTEIVAPEGYELDPNAQPVDVSVDVVKDGLVTAIDGGEGAQATVNNDNLVFRPNWGTNDLLVDTALSGGDAASVRQASEFNQGEVFIKNGGNPITLLKAEIDPAHAANYTTLHNPQFVLSDLAGNEVTGGEGTLAEVREKLNELIATNGMLTVNDSYSISNAGNANGQPVIYLDTKSAERNSYKAQPGGYAQTNKPLPLQLSFEALKNFNGATPENFKFSFALDNPAALPAVPELNFASPTFPIDKVVTVGGANGATATADFGVLAFDKPGTYTFTMKEKADQAASPHIQWDDEPRTIIVEITEVKDAAPGDGVGGLHAKITVKAPGEPDKVFDDLYSSNCYPDYDPAKPLPDQNSVPIKFSETFVNSVGPTIEKANDRDLETLKAGDALTYTLTLTNPTDKPVEVNVTDAVSAQLKVTGWEVDGAVGDVDTNKQWDNGTPVAITLPAAANGKPGTATIKLHCEVEDGFDAANANSNIILNQAKMTYENPDGTPGEAFTDTKVNLLAPTPSYTMTKARVTKAPESVATPGKFGFAPGTKNVEYEVTVKNTGDLPLSMTVGDSFDDAGNFENVRAIKAVVAGVEHTADDAAVAGFGTDAVQLADLPAGEEAVITFAADVRADAKENIDAEALNKGNGVIDTNPNGGWQNTATATDATTKYEQPTHAIIVDGNGNVVFEMKPDADGDGKPEITINKTDSIEGGKLAVGTTETVLDRNNTAELDDKWSIDRTPVKNYVLGYEMHKERVTDAGKLNGSGDPGKFGFVAGDKVEYLIVVTNAGDAPLRMNVSDTFADSEFFTDVRFTKMAIDNDAWTADTAGIIEGIGSDQVIISLPAGKTANLTVTAVVSEKATVLPDSAPNRTWSGANADDDQAAGHENTALAADVKAFEPKDDGWPDTDKPSLPDDKNVLVDKDDTAKTPVIEQVVEPTPPPEPPETDVPPAQGDPGDKPDPQSAAFAQTSDAIASLARALLVLAAVSFAAWGLAAIRLRGRRFATEAHGHQSARPEAPQSGRHARRDD